MFRTLLVSIAASGEEGPEMDYSIELLYELTFVYCHRYAAEFTPLRRFIDDEIVPVRIHFTISRYSRLGYCRR